jgi:hypothetical protein
MHTFTMTCVHHLAKNTRKHSPYPYLKKLCVKNLVDLGTSEAPPPLGNRGLVTSLSTVKEFNRIAHLCRRYVGLETASAIDVISTPIYRIYKE